MIAIDKVKHFVAGAALFVAGEAVGLLLQAPYGLIGSGLVIVIAAIKEAYDSLGYGTPEWWDFYATLAGGLVVMIIMEMLI